MELLERLRRAREKAGLSLEELSSRTKIQLSILQAIEGGAFDRVPGGLFVRGFLRAYAREVGLDPEEIVAQYMTEYDVPPPAPAAPDEDVQDVETDEEAAPRSFWRRLWPATLFGGVLIALVSSLADEPRTAPVPEPVPVGTTGSGVPEPVQETRQVDSLTLEIRAKRAVWVAAMADGEKVIYRVMQPDERATVHARRQFAARIGDAEAFDYTVNGVPGRSLGAPGEVRDVVITPENYQTFRRQ